MTYYARQRADLLEQKLEIPTGSGAFITVPDWMEYTQPENLEDHAYNAVLWKTTESGQKYAWHRVMSIDLEFKEEK